MASSRIAHKAEHVGSFLRPAEIQQARAAWKAGTLDAARLRAAEDTAIATLVRTELAHGVRSVSDGEFRREYFHLDFIQHLGGITITDNTLPGDDPTPPTVSVTSKLRHVAPIEVDNFRFLQKQLDAAGGKTKDGQAAVVKIAIPSPTMVHFRGGRKAVDIVAYPEMDAFFEDLAACWRAEIKALGEAGCKFVQLDDTNVRGCVYFNPASAPDFLASACIPLRSQNARSCRRARRGS
jgi:5-methyltetrahydropteroyltriglutamate--homocysteine methyltransferase